MPALLQLDKATIRFGGLTAVADLDLQIQENELVGLIGPNGAGKTTAFNLITGVYQPTSSPAPMCRFTSETAVNPPKRMVTFSSWSNIIKN